MSDQMIVLKPWPCPLLANLKSENFIFNFSLFKILMYQFMFCKVS